MSDKICNISDAEGSRNRISDVLPSILTTLLTKTGFFSFWSPIGVDIRFVVSSFSRKLWFALCLGRFLPLSSSTGTAQVSFSPCPQVRYLDSITLASWVAAVLYMSKSGCAERFLVPLWVALRRCHHQVKRPYWFLGSFSTLRHFPCSCWRPGAVSFVL